jgi:hypothetical protein
LQCYDFSSSNMTFKSLKKVLGATKNVVSPFPLLHSHSVFLTLASATPFFVMVIRTPRR